MVKKSVFALLSFLTTRIAFAQTGNGATALSTSTTPVQIIVKYYNFALYLGGAIVFCLVVWGGIQYLVAAGGSGKENGKDRIYKALLGFGILLGTYLILNFISPGLTVLQLPQLESIKATPTQTDQINPNISKNQATNQCKGTQKGDNCDSGKGCSCTDMNNDPKNPNYACTREIIKNERQLCPN